MATMTGPAGGDWCFTDAGVANLRCVVCTKFVERAWRYWVGLVARETVCERCIEGALREHFARGES